MTDLLDLKWISDWERAHSRYFLKYGEQDEQEVSEAEFIAAERSAGFIPKSGCGPLATAGFSTSAHGGVTGRIEYKDNSQ